MPGHQGLRHGAMASCPGEVGVLKREHLHKLGRPTSAMSSRRGKTILNLLDKMDKAQDSWDGMYASLDLRRHLCATCAYEPDNDAENPTVRAVLPERTSGQGAWPALSRLCLGLAPRMLQATPCLKGGGSTEGPGRRVLGLGGNRRTGRPPDTASAPTTTKTATVRRFCVLSCSQFYKKDDLLTIDVESSPGRGNKVQFMRFVALCELHD